MESTNRIIERSKAEIEDRLSAMGDYVKMDYLQRALRSGLDFDTKKFVMTRLGEIYEKKGMFLEAARMIKASSDINTTFKAKIEDLMRVVELYVKGGDFQEAEVIFRQALVMGNESQRKELKEKIKKIYADRAEYYLKIDRRNNAKTVLEKTLALELSPKEKEEVELQLLELYEKLGKINEYFNLKNNMAQR